MSGLFGTTAGPVWGLEPCLCGHPSCKRAGTSNGVFYQGCGYDPADARVIAQVPAMLELVEAVANETSLSAWLDHVAAARKIAAELEKK